MIPSDYRALQPFGQVPILEEDGLVLFESGAIVLHIGARSEMLLPKDAAPCTCCGSKAADLQHPSARSTDIALAFNTRAEDWG
jgi:glutathione S-transferase